MRFLIDESAGVAVAAYLRDPGHDVLAVAELTPQAKDPDILAWAARDRRVLITNDKDFGELVYRGGHAHQGVPLLRLQDDNSANRLRVPAAIVADHSEHLEGHFVVATDTIVRVRPVADREDTP